MMRLVGDKLRELRVGRLFLVFSRHTGNRERRHPLMSLCIPDMKSQLCFWRRVELILHKNSESCGGNGK